jgi:archaellum component FlaC
VSQRIEERLDKVDEKLNSIDKHLAVYNEQLKEHIRRSNMLELEMKPVKAHVALMNSLAKILVALGAIVSFTIGLYKAIK